MGRLIFIFSLLMLSTHGITAQRVIHPSMSGMFAERFNDLFELLELALEKTQDDYGDYQLIPMSFTMTESRLLKEVKSGNNLDIIWSSTSPQKEEELIPIRIPLRKGILGYRISLIHKDNQFLFDPLKSLEDLQAFRIGQGIGWGDINIYKENNIPVGNAPYESLFSLIGPRRFHLFPRGITEIYNELALYGTQNPNLTIEKNLVLHYPWPYYFFTSKQNKNLAMRIEAGLERMIKDGSFDRIFDKYNAEAIQKSELDKRHLIRLNNPFLPENTPLDRQELWFVPSEASIK